MRVIPAFVVLIIASSLPSFAACAQDSAHVITSRPVANDEIPTLDLAIGGVKGAFAGAGAGALLGLGVGAIGCHASARDWCTLTYGLGGALAGQFVGTPVGVHLANHRRGNVVLTTVGSVTATLALLAVGSTFTRGNGAPFILTMPFEIGAAIPIERYIERR